MLDSLYFISDFIKRALFQNYLFELMTQCLYFINYRFDVMGFHISVLNVIIVTEVFELTMDKLAVLFGKKEVEDE